jgi:hypothetical protein
MQRTNQYTTQLKIKNKRPPRVLVARSSAADQGRGGGIWRAPPTKTKGLLGVLCWCFSDWRLGFYAYQPLLFAISRRWSYVHYINMAPYPPG